MGKSIVFNPFTGNFDIISEVTLSAVGSSPNTSGASLSSSQVLNLQPADGTNPGVITAGTQTLGGNKTFTGAISASNLSGTNTGDVTLGTANGLSIVGQVLSLGLSSTSTTGALSSTDWNTFNNKQSALTIGNLTDVGTDGIVITGGTGAVIGSGTSIAQHVADSTHNGYLSSTDWSTFNSKQDNIPATSSTFYVDKNRVDSYTADGSIGKPYKTIQAAINRVIALAVNTSAEPALIIIVGGGTYVENITLNSLALQGIVIQGLEATYIQPASGNALDCSSNNNNLTYFVVNGLFFVGPVNIVGASNNTVMFQNMASMHSCVFNNTLTVKNVVSFQITESQINDNQVIENIPSMAITGGAGIAPGTTCTVTWNAGNNKPSGATQCVLNIDRTIAGADPTVSVGALLQYREGTRVGYPGGTITLNGDCIGYNSFFRSNVVVNAGGSFTNNGCFSNGTVTGAGTYTNNTTAQQIAFTPATSGNWLTIPTQVKGALDTLAVSGIAKTQSANTVLSGPTTGAAALPTFRALVAADIPSLPYASSTLTNAHIFVGNVSNVATDVAVTGDVTISNAGVTAIGANKVANSQLAQMAAHTFKGNNTGSTANALDLTATQLTAELNNFVGDTGSGGTKGLVPAPAAGDAAAGKFLKADGSWATAGAVSPLTTKGDLYTFSTVNARLPVGTNGYFLTADSAQTTGLSWTQTLPIANGGTGQTSASAAFSALSPVTTTGDIIYSSSGTTNSRLPIGSGGQVLTVSGGVPAWATANGTGTYVASTLTTRVTATPAAPGEYRTLIRNGASSFTLIDNAPSTGPSSSNGLLIYGVAYTVNGTSGQPSRWEVYVGTGLRVQFEFYNTTGRTGYIMTTPQSNVAPNVIAGLVCTYDPATGIAAIDGCWTINSTDTSHYVGFYPQSGAGAGTNNMTANNATSCYVDIKAW